MFIKHRFVNHLKISFILCIGISIGACSSSPNKVTKLGVKSKSKPASTISDKKIEEYTRQDNSGVSNAHVHPATESARSYRHVHPNGANKHSHH